jgi:hypothetical protein
MAIQRRFLDQHTSTIGVVILATRLLSLVVVAVAVDRLFWKGSLLPGAGLLSLGILIFMIPYFPKRKEEYGNGPR